MATVTLRPTSATASSWSSIANAYDTSTSTSATVSIKRSNYSSRTATFNFNTSSIPSGATINSATLYVNAQASTASRITMYADINGSSSSRVINSSLSTSAANYTADVKSYMSSLSSIKLTGYMTSNTSTTFTLYDVRIEVDYTETVQYTVTFKDWDGTTLKTQTVNSGASATAPSNPTRTGYTFTGWDKAFTNVTSNLTVTAQYSIKTYTVTFKDYDGSTLKTETVNHGSSATPPSDPTRTGYTFTGWSGTYTNITSNTTITAQYEKQSSIMSIGGSVIKELCMGDVPIIEAYIGDVLLYSRSSGTDTPVDPPSSGEEHITTKTYTLADKNSSATSGTWTLNGYSEYLGIVNGNTYTLTVDGVEYEYTCIADDTGSMYLGQYGEYIIYDETKLEASGVMGMSNVCNFIFGYPSGKTAPTTFSITGVFAEVIPTGYYAGIFKQNEGGYIINNLTNAKYEGYVSIVVEPKGDYDVTVYANDGYVIDSILWEEEGFYMLDPGSTSTESPYGYNNVNNNATYIIEYKSVSSSEGGNNEGGDMLEGLTWNSGVGVVRTGFTPNNQSWIDTIHMPMSGGEWSKALYIDVDIDISKCEVGVLEPIISVGTDITSGSTSCFHVYFNKTTDTKGVIHTVAKYGTKTTESDTLSVTINSRKVRIAFDSDYGYETGKVGDSSLAWDTNFDTAISQCCLTHTPIYVGLASGEYSDAITYEISVATYDY